MSLIVWCEVRQNNWNKKYEQFTIWTEKRREKQQIQIRAEQTCHSEFSVFVTVSDVPLWTINWVQSRNRATRNKKKLSPLEKWFLLSSFFSHWGRILVHIMWFESIPEMMIVHKNQLRRSFDKTKYVRNLFCLACHCRRPFNYCESFIWTFR